MTGKAAAQPSRRLPRNEEHGLERPCHTLLNITSEQRRAIPSIDRLMRDIGLIQLPRQTVLSIVRTQADYCRAGQFLPIDLASKIDAAIQFAERQRTRPVINATGIIIHTNLGRSPLAAEAIEAMAETAENYTNVEFDLDTGRRGGRARSIEDGLALLCAAPAATVVNNCAAALLLCVHHFIRNPTRKEVIISRGELVQIGGGFRIPDMLESAGAILKEVGTTNRTIADDYAGGISDRTAIILKVHHSNFVMSGFVESASLEKLAPIAHAANIPLVDDLGSGAVTGAAGEPTPADSLAAGADLVLFSGDKMFGGPQAGIIAGDAAAVAALKSCPMFRAFRCDKMQLAALAATVDLYLNANVDRLPIHQMINLPIATLEARARSIVDNLQAAAISIAAGVSRIGGGAAPEATIPSIVLKIQIADADQFMTRLRHASTPVIAYVDNKHVLLDLRTVLPTQDAALTDAIRKALVS